jgi:hypothetical protein
MLVELASRAYYLKVGEDILYCRLFTRRIDSCHLSNTYLRKTRIDIYIDVGSWVDSLSEPLSELGFKPDLTAAFMDVSLWFSSA